VGPQLASRSRAGAGAHDGGTGPGPPTGLGLVEFHAYDLLARGLYERLGYETVGVIKGHPAGSATRWYRKDL